MRIFGIGFRERFFIDFGLILASFSSSFSLFFGVFSACFFGGPGGRHFGPRWRRSEPERGHGLVKFSAMRPVGEPQRGIFDYLIIDYW